MDVKSVNFHLIFWSKKWFLSKALFFYKICSDYLIIIWFRFLNKGEYEWLWKELSMFVREIYVICRIWKLSCHISLNYLWRSHVWKWSCEQYSHYLFHWKWALNRVSIVNIVYQYSECKVGYSTHLFKWQCLAKFNLWTIQKKSRLEEVIGIYIRGLIHFIPEFITCQIFKSYVDME